MKVATARVQPAASPLEPPSCVIKEVIRPMHAQSKSILVSGSNGLHYVLKLPSGSQDGRLFKKAFGAALGRSVQLSMAHSMQLEFDPHTSAIYPDFFQGEDVEEHLPLAPGVYFGSQIMTAERQLLEYLPQTFIRQSPATAKAFAEVSLFDLWIGNEKRRRYIGHYLGAERRLSVYFIGSGSILNTSSHSTVLGDTGFSRYAHACTMVGGRKVIDDFICRLLALSPPTIETLFEQTPPVWSRSVDFEALLKTLISRLRALEAAWEGWKERLSV